MTTSSEGFEPELISSARPFQPRRGPADPVRSLMHRHRDLCARAVDPLEIAAGLEAHGVTDRTAVRFRHRDVFSLAEELYARVPRSETPVGSTPSAPGTASDRGRDRRARAVRWALYLLPGVLAAAVVAGLGLSARAGPSARLAVGAAGTVLVLAGLRLCLRGGSLTLRGPGYRAAIPSACWLLGYALCGDALLAELLAGGPHGLWFAPGPATAAPLVALAFAVAPAAWCARWFAVRSRRRLTASRGLAEFAAGIRPLLPAAVLLFTGALVTLMTAVVPLLGQRAYPGADTYPTGGGRGAGALASVAALGVLLFVARLLAVHGRPRAAAAGTVAACVVEALVLGSVLVGRLPGCAVAGRPVELAVAAHGPAIVPLIACATSAIVLLAMSTVLLARASAHSGSPAP